MAAQKFQTAYHFMFDYEQLQTPLLVSPVALIKLHRRARSRVAWTEFGGVGEGRRTSLRQIDKFSQIRATPGWTPSFAEKRGYTHQANMQYGRKKAALATHR